MFGSKSAVFISGVGSGMDSGCSVRVSGLGSVLPGLVLKVTTLGQELEYIEQKSLQL